VRAGLDGALADFRDSRYGRLSVTLPRLISAGHVLAAGGGDSGQRDALLAGIYTLTTRMLIKLDDQQLGWMAADRAGVLASGGGDALAVGEAARNLAVLARKAGWHEQASCIALLSAEREAPEETHARPAVRDLVSSLLVTGRTGPELRGLAARCGIT